MLSAAVSVCMTAPALVTDGRRSCFQDNAYKEKPVVDSWMNLKATDLGGDPYQSSEDDSIYLVAPGADKDNWG